MGIILVFGVGYFFDYPIVGLIVHQYDIFRPTNFPILHWFVNKA